MSGIRRCSSAGSRYLTVFSSWMEEMKAEACVLLSLEERVLNEPREPPPRGEAPQRGPPAKRTSSSRRKAPPSGSEAALAPGSRDHQMMPVSGVAAGHPEYWQSRWNPSKEHLSIPTDALLAYNSEKTNETRRRRERFETETAEYGKQMRMWAWRDRMIAPSSRGGTRETSLGDDVDRETRRPERRRRTFRIRSPERDEKTGIDPNARPAEHETHRERPTNRGNVADEQEAEERPI
ncbi:unnamed protein product [Arctogadus glacialis]